MTTPDTEPNTREGLFRFGQRFVNKNIQFKYYRDIMTRLLCVDIINEAFSDGVILTQKGEDGKKTEDQKNIPLRLPADWYLSTSESIHYRSNGICDGGKLRLHYRERAIDLVLQTPHCRPETM